MDAATERAIARDLRALDPPVARASKRRSGSATKSR
jgi:hypothetical protein